MTEINKQINHCDFKINEDLLVEIGIFKEILKVSKESRREFGSIYYDTIEELDILKWRLVDLQSENNIDSHLFDIENVENRITELMMETTKFQQQIDLHDAEIENNPLSLLLLEVKEMIFRIRDSISDLECLKFNGEADQCELVSAMSHEDDPILIFNLKNRYDAISFNINNWETLLINLKNCKIYYEYYLNVINE